jgi:hypothetical protein
LLLDASLEECMSVQRIPLALRSHAVILAALVLAACVPPPSEEDSTEISLSVGSGGLSIRAGESVQVAVVVSTAAGVVYVLQYASSDAAIAQVSSAGVVSGLATPSRQRRTARRARTAAASSCSAGSDVSQPMQASVMLCP